MKPGMRAAICFALGLILGFALGRATAAGVGYASDAELYNEINRRVAIIKDAEGEAAWPSKHQMR